MKKNGKKRSKNKPPLLIKIDQKYLYNLWKKQEGKCAVTGVPLIMGVSNFRRYNLNRCMMASIDRIDSNMHYEADNVRFVLSLLNYGQRDYSDEEMLECLAHILASPTMQKKTSEFFRNFRNRLFSNRQGEETASRGYAHEH